MWSSDEDESEVNINDLWNDKKEEEDEKPKLSGQGRSGNEENKATHLTAVTSGGPKSKKMTTHKLVGVSDEIQLD